MLRQIVSDFKPRRLAGHVEMALGANPCVMIEDSQGYAVLVAHRRIHRGDPEIRRGLAENG